MTKLGLSVEEAAASAGVGRTLIFQEIRAGRLKVRKVGSRTIILVPDLENWLNALPAKGGEAIVTKAA